MKITIDFSLEELDLLGSLVARDRDHRVLPAAGHGSGRTRLLTDAEEAVAPLHQAILGKIEDAIRGGL